jgi:chorismate mutase
VFIHQFVQDLDGALKRIPVERGTFMDLVGALKMTRSENDGNLGGTEAPRVEVEPCSDSPREKEVRKA